MPAKSKTVVITWLDGKQETYPNLNDVIFTDAVLSLHPRSWDEPVRRFPLENIRTWTED